MKKLVIFGTGELAEVADFYFREDSDHEVVAFTVDGAHAGEDSFAGRPVIPFEELAAHHGSDEVATFAAIGYSRTNGVRQEKCDALKAAGYTLASYISSRANVFSNVEIGENAFLLEDNTIQPFVKIGRGVTLWSGNHVGHHSVVHDFAFISSHVVISGGVTIGQRCFLGVNATLNDHLEIGERCVIGSGSLVPKSLPPYSVTIAEPSRIAKVPSNKLRGM